MIISCNPLPKNFADRWADLRKPTVSKLTNSKRRPGLVELIVGKTTIENCIIRDRKNPWLSVLHHGMIPPDPLELFSSSSFRTLLEELKGPYKYIVIDSPPILPVSDAIVLAHAAVGLILAVEANKTTHWTGRQVTKKLSKANVNVLGLVLSKMDSRKSYYYSKYGNYYASYSGNSVQQIGTGTS